jgi:hypothetical protein
MINEMHTLNNEFEIYAEIFIAWFLEATVAVLCVMFITNEGFVYWCNFKIPPHTEYTVVILVLGLAGGLFCFCWEVQRKATYTAHSSHDV